MKLLTQNFEDVVGKVQNPLPLEYQNISGSPGGLVLFFTNILKLTFIVAGIWAFLNFIIAGFQYMTAGGDTKSLTNAWGRIWQSLLGMVIIVGSFALAMLMGQLFFGDPMYILNPKIYGPNQ